MNDTVWFTKSETGTGGRAGNIGSGFSGFRFPAEEIC